MTNTVWGVVSWGAVDSWQTVCTHLQSQTCGGWTCIVPAIVMSRMMSLLFISLYFGRCCGWLCGARYFELDFLNAWLECFHRYVKCMGTAKLETLLDLSGWNLWTTIEIISRSFQRSLSTVYFWYQSAFIAILFKASLSTKN